MTNKSRLTNESILNATGQQTDNRGPVLHETDNKPFNMPKNSLGEMKPFDLKKLNKQMKINKNVA
jgi:hypothetical protein